MKLNMKKITVVVLGVAMMSGVCSTDANAAPRSQRHGSNHHGSNHHRPATVKYRNNTGAVLAAGAIGTIAGLAIGVSTSNYRSQPYRSYYTPRYAYYPTYREQYCGSYLDCRQSWDGYYEECYKVYTPCYY